MRDFHGKRSAIAPTAVTLALPLLAIGFIAAVGGNVAAQPAPLVIVGTANNIWKPASVKVAVGDVISWQIEGGSHGVQFSPADCKIALDKLTFTPALDNCKTATVSKGEIVSAKVNKALDKALGYFCTKHGTAMKGNLKP